MKSTDYMSDDEYAKFFDIIEIFETASGQQIEIKLNETLINSDKRVLEFRNKVFHHFTKRNKILKDIDEEYLKNTFNLNNKNEEIYIVHNPYPTHIILQKEIDNSSKIDKQIGVDVKEVKHNRFLSYLNTVKYILPKSYREALLGDLNEIYYELKQTGHHSLWIYTILSFNFVIAILLVITNKSSEIFRKEKL